ncbi:MAG: hypothetical protein AAGF95_13180 [Chloroflexota bacterium]
MLWWRRIPRSFDGDGNGGWKPPLQVMYLGGVPPPRGGVLSMGLEPGANVG